MLTTNLSNREIFTLMDAMFGSRTEDQNRVPVLALPIDVFERDGVLNVRTAMPGVAPERVEISVEDNLLTIAGENHSAMEVSDVKFYRRETVSGQFKRTVRLGDEFDASKATAQFSNGIVTILIPRAETAKPRIVRIPVSTIAESGAMSVETVGQELPSEPSES